VAQLVGSIGIFHRLNPSGRNMALCSAQPLTLGSPIFLCQNDTPVIVDWFASGTWKNNTK